MVGLFICGALFVFLPKFFIGSRNDRKKPRSMVKTAPCGILELFTGISGKDIISFFIKLKERSKCDVFKLSLPFVSNEGVFVVSDPKVAREVLLDDGTEKTPRAYERFDHVTKGKSMFTRKTHDFKWIHARKGSAPAFSTSEVKRMSQICTQNVENWISSTLKNCIEKKETFDPSKEMNFVFFVTILEVGFEYKATYDDYKDVSESMEKAVLELFLKSANPLRRIFRKIFGMLLQDRREAIQARDKVRSFMSKVLKAYHAKKQKSSQNTIIKLIVNNPNYENDDERLADMTVYFVAGHDTTAYSLSSTMILLAKNPHVAEKLRSELATMDSSNWSNSEYLRCIIKESSRLIPVGPLISRIAGKDIYFKDGSLMIPKDAIVIISQILINLNPNIYPNPKKFDPERWLNPTKEEKDAYIPFALGKRNCAGQRLATTELHSCIPLLFLKYKFEVAEEGKLSYLATYKYEGTRLNAVKLV